MAFVRFRSGVVGETRRTVHLVELPAGVADTLALNELPHVLTALCGQGFAPGTADVLAGIAGMPCVDCVRRSPGTDRSCVAPQRLPGGDRR